VAYDFNLAFDEDFNRERFFGAHVFGRMLREWPEGFHERMVPRLRDALGQVRTIFSELPRESALRFGEIRTFMADEPEKAVEELFRRYVKVEDAAGAVSGS
jgi:hypothetical protein